MLIRETYLNKDRDMIFGETGWYEPYTIDKGKLFRSLQKEYGRCVSKVYLDELQVNGMMVAIPHGWVFQKKDKYEDTGERYMREVWVSVREE